MQSGLPSLAVAISELMQTGGVADAIAACRTMIEAIGKNHIACLETGIEVLAAPEFTFELAKDKLDALAALREGLAARFNALLQDLAEIQAQKLAQLRADLDRTLRECLAEAASDPAESITLSHVSQIDMRLRVKLENVFLSAFDGAAQSVQAALGAFNAEAKSLPDESGLIDKLAVELTAKGAFSGPPPLAALAEPAALGLAATLNELAALSLPQAREKDNLLQAAVADFEPILAGLAQEAEAILATIPHHLSRQISMLAFRPIETAMQRIANIVSAAANPDSAEAQAAARELEETGSIIARLRSVLAASATENQVQQAALGLG
jgi:hypothetical protein